MLCTTFLGIHMWFEGVVMIEFIMQYVSVALRVRNLILTESLDNVG